MTQYGVFILSHGEWRLTTTFQSLHSAKQEQRYLTQMLGLTAQVFQRPVKKITAHTK